MFDHVLVDEYQDTNALQADILEGMRPADTARNLTVVGDDAQSIYAFRAATVRNILEFPDALPGRHGRQARAELPLDAADPRRVQRRDRARRRSATRRRSGRRATGERRPCCARASTRRSSATRSAAPCSSTASEGVPLKHQAVLFRAAHHSDLLEVELGAPQHPVREVRRPEVPRGGPREGRAGAPAHPGEPVRRGELVPRAAAAGGHRARPRRGR